MARLAPQTLTPIEPEAQTRTIDTSVANDCVTFVVGSWDWFQIELVQVAGGAWTATAVISLQWSLDGSNFLAFPVAITFGDTTTPHDRFRVTGLHTVRAIVITAAGAAGAAKFCVLARGAQDP